MKVKGWKYRVHHCTVCGKEAYHGTQARPLCYTHEQMEKVNPPKDYCCDCGAELKNVPAEWHGLDDLLCIDCMKKENERLQ